MPNFELVNLLKELAILAKQLFYVERISGAIWGGVLGALFGFLFPPVGLLVAAGPIVGVLASGRLWRRQER